VLARSRVCDDEVGFAGAVATYWKTYFFVVVTMHVDNRAIEGSFHLLLGRGLFTAKRQEAASRQLLQEI
jgi:hypothetical protein